MTQPPSQQPPQGGSGSPQDPQGAPQPPSAPPSAPPGTPPAAPPPSAPPAQPPAPGYGYPQAPGQPPAPGYGYPQAPGQPGPYGQPAPGQPNPYAQPPGAYGRQPNPYAQPGTAPQPGPYGQQPGPYGGYPPQPPYPGAPVPAGAPGSGGGGFFKGRPGIVIAAATAGLLAVGGVTWWAVSGDDDPKAPVAKPSAPATAQEPSGAASAEVDKGDGSGGGRAQDDDLNAGRQPGEAKVEWLVKNDQDLPRNGADVFGPWVVGDTIVKALYRKIEGFSVADGKKKWSIPFQTDICQSAPAPNADGIIVISVKDGTGDRANCRVMQQIDLKSGKAGWKKEIPQDGGPFSKLSEASLAIAGNTVTAAGTGNSYGFSLTDGKQLYGRPDETCKPFAFAGAGARLIGAASCPVDDYANPQHEVWDVDPATGKPKWKYRLKRGWSVDKVYSVSPLVVNVVNNEKKQRAVLALKDDGTQRSQLSSGRDEGFRAECSGGLIVFGENLQDCAGVVADADTFYMATEPTSGLRGTNELVAFDLNTGKPKWRTSAGSERTLVPIRKEGAEVVVYIKPTYDSGGAVATVSATGGKPKVLLQHPSSVARVERDFWSTRYAYAGGRFFLASGRVSAQNDKAELETKTMMAFAK